MGVGRVLDVEGMMILLLWGVWGEVVFWGGLLGYLLIGELGVIGFGDLWVFCGL